MRDEQVTRDNSFWHGCDWTLPGQCRLIDLLTMAAEQRIRGIILASPTVYVPGPMSIRSFIAIPLPKELANALGDAAAQMAYQDKSNAVRWVDQDNYHITLAFLGEQEESNLELLAEHLDNNLQQNGIPIAIDHCSPFPEARPKMIAAMLIKDSPLENLYQQVNASIFASPVRVEKRRFKPHITLGRYRHSKNRYMGAITTSMKLTAEITEVSIFQSTLSPSGAVYEAIFRFPLDQLVYDPNEI
ncbi:MAG: RNA 2',3'-cyclic phosphodiesterase [Gammaproteobacteria bacterium]|nr:RNA 2',3'-cyclic phosphodiesterase [Gammaproteobacteria bacterium]